MTNIIQLTRQTRGDVHLRAASFDAQTNTVEVIWTTGAKVRRYSWRDDGYYDEELIVDASSVRLERLNGGAPFLNTHDDWDLSSVIGTVVPGSAAVAGGKGLARVQLSVAPEHAGIVANIKAGIIRNISVGYRIHKVEKTESDDGQVPVWRVIDWEPLELSAVPVPADAGSTIRAESVKEGEKPRLFPCEFIEARGAVGAASTEATMPEADQISEQTTAPSIVEANGENAAAVNAERRRAAAIREIATRSGAGALGEQHARTNTTVDEFRAIVVEHLAAEDANRGQTISHFGVQMGETDQEKRGAAIEAALLHRANPSRYELTNEARNFRSMSLIEIARDVLEARGVKTRGMARMELAGAALNYRSGGGYMSTGDFPAILSNVLNKTLRAGYEAMPQTFRPLVKIGSVSDFKPVSRVQLGEAPAFEKVNEHGEFKRGAMAESAESFSIATYGKIIAITRQVIVNDDLDAFSRIPAAFGVQAAQLESDLVWGIILMNAAMADGYGIFHANHKNLASAGGAISLSAVSDGRTAMAKQTGLDGKTVLNLSPEYLIVPSELQTMAEQFRGQIYPAKTSDSVPDSLKNLGIVSEPRLSSGVHNKGIGIDVAGSPSAWYLAGNQGIVDIIELAYLDGNTGVYTETRQGFDVDGLEVKARMDVGAKALDWRNVYKNPGS